MAGIQKRKRRSGVGRPPEGPDGSKVSTYPRLAIRVPRETKSRLEALALLRGTPAWKVVDAALVAYFDELPDAERRLLAQIASRRAK